MTTQVKPGTRCECRGVDTHSHVVASPEAYRTGNHRQCLQDATRLVTIPLPQGVIPGTWADVIWQTVPMCQSCAPISEARYHEALQSLTGGLQ